MDDESKAEESLEREPGEDKEPVRLQCRHGLLCLSVPTIGLADAVSSLQAASVWRG